MQDRKSFWQQDIKKKEYLFAAFKSLLLMLGVGWLFYDSWTAIILLIPLGILSYRQWEEKKIKEQQKCFREEFQNALQSLAAALNIGYSMENAVKEVHKDLQLLYSEQQMIVREFTYMVHQLNLNVTAMQVWNELAERVRLEEVQSFAIIFVLSKKSGGDSIKIIRNAVSRIGDKADVKREIETVIAAKRLEFQVMSAIPFGIIGYMRVSFPEFMEVLYGNIAGKVFMSSCLLMYLAAWWLGCRIIEIEV